MLWVQQKPLGLYRHGFIAYRGFDESHLQALFESTNCCLRRGVAWRGAARRGVGSFAR